MFIYTYYYHIHVGYISYDCHFKNITHIFFFHFFLPCPEKVYGNKELSRGNSNPRRESRNTNPGSF